MENESLTRQVAKWMVGSAINLTVARAVATLVDDHTSLEQNSIPVKLGAGAVGMVVAAKAKPHTDKIVDQTFDFVITKRVEFVAKRNAKKQEK